MKYITIIIIFISFLYCNNIMVFSVSDNIYDATKKAKELQQKIEHSNILNYKYEKKPIVTTIKVDNKWLLVSPINDQNSVYKIGIIAKDKYPSILIVKNSKIDDIKTKDKTDMTIEWSLLILIGIVGIFSVIWLLRKMSKIKAIQNELEEQQIILMKKILKSENYV